MQQSGFRQPFRHGGMMTGVLLVAPAERQHQEALGQRGGDPHPGDQPGVFVAGVARYPLGLILHVGAVQRLQLPPPREEQQKTSPQPRHRTGPERGTLLERVPEHREVQRNTGNANAFGVQGEVADHQFDGAVGRLWRTAHQVQGDAGGSPRDQRQHRDDLVVAVDRFNQQAVTVGRVAEPAQRHRKTTLGLGIAPGVSAAQWCRPSRRGRCRGAGGCARSAPTCAPGLPPGAPRACPGRTT